MQRAQEALRMDQAALAKAFAAVDRSKEKDTKGNDSNKLAHRYLWTPLEDEVLIIFVKKLRPADFYGSRKVAAKQIAWDRVAASFNTEFATWKQQHPYINITVNTRDGKSCRSRWKYHVSLARTKRGEKVPLSAAEDDYIIYMQSKLSNKWSLISAELSARFGVHRTDNDVKNRWNSKLQHLAKKRLAEGLKNLQIPPLPAPGVVPSRAASEDSDAHPSAKRMRPTVDSKLHTIKPSTEQGTATKWPVAGRLEQLLDVPPVLLKRLKDLRGSEEPPSPSDSLDGEDDSDCYSDAEEQCDTLTSSGSLSSAAASLDPSRLTRQESNTTASASTLVAQEGRSALGRLGSSAVSTKELMSALVPPEPLAAANRASLPEMAQGLALPTGLLQAQLQRAVSLLLKKVEDQGQMLSLTQQLAAQRSRAPLPLPLLLADATRQPFMDNSFSTEMQALISQHTQAISKSTHARGSSSVAKRKASALKAQVDYQTKEMEDMLANMDSILAHGHQEGLNLNVKPEPDYHTMLHVAEVDELSVNIDAFWS